MSCVLFPAIWLLWNVRRVLSWARSQKHLLCLQRLTHVRKLCTCLKTLAIIILGLSSTFHSLIVLPVVRGRVFSRDFHHFSTTTTLHVFWSCMRCCCLWHAITTELTVSFLLHGIIILLLPLTPPVLCKIYSFFFFLRVDGTYSIDSAHRVLC